MRFVNLSFVLIINKHDSQKTHLDLSSEITSLKGEYQMFIPLISIVWTAYDAKADV